MNILVDCLRLSERDENESWFLIEVNFFICIYSEFFLFSKLNKCLNLNPIATIGLIVLLLGVLDFIK